MISNQQKFSIILIVQLVSLVSSFIVNKRTCIRNEIALQMSNKNVIGIPKAIAIASSLFFFTSVSSADDFSVYRNDRYETSFQYPSTWENRKGVISAGRIVEAFVDPSDPDTSVSLVITPIPGDYTKLTSFGVGKDTIRDYVLPRGEGISTTLLEEKVKGEAYYAEYIVSAPDAPTRHIQSIFALRPQESVVGLTVQAREDVFEKTKDVINKIAPSFKHMSQQ